MSQSSGIASGKQTLKGTMKSAFENLRVYRLSEELADEIWDLVLGWNNFAKDTVGRQLVRAADSIGANIAEGTGRGTFQDNRRFLRTARGSLRETQHFLRRAFRRKLIAEAQVKTIKPLIDELAPRLNAYLKSIGTVKAQGESEQRDE
ncbi:MAG TPA: four helix bundle protein [Anaerolineales bacterium]